MIVKLVLIILLCIVQDLIAKCPKKCPVCYKINVEIAWQPFCNYSGGFHERTPLSREKGVLN